jgi:hypothetical protein
MFVRDEAEDEDDDDVEDDDEGGRIDRLGCLPRLIVMTG